MFPLVVLCSLAAFCSSDSVADEPSDNALQHKVTRAEISTSDIRARAARLRSEQFHIATEVLRAFPNDFNAVRVMGFAHSSHGNRDKMLLCWKRCRQLEPNRPDVYDYLGRFHAVDEKFDLAIQMWNRSLELDPNIAGVRNRMAQAYLNLAKPAEAEKVLLHQLKLTPNGFQTNFLYGETLFQLQRYEESKRSFHRARTIAPMHAKACYGMLKSCQRLGEQKEVRKYAAEFQRLDQLEIQADLQMRKKFDDLSEVQQRVCTTLVDAGRVYLLNKKPERATQSWKRALQIDPNNLAAIEQLAKLAMSQDHFESGLSYYERLLDLDPDNLRILRTTGSHYAARKQNAQAEKKFRQMVKVAPKQAIGYQALARFFLTTNRNKQESLALANQAMRLNPNAESHFLLGWSSAMNGQVNKAKVALRKAVELSPNNRSYRRVLSVVEANSE